MEKIVIEKINRLLAKHNEDLYLDNFDVGESESVLAFFSPSFKTISINKNNKQIFNDYVQFIETMFHEHAHKINDSLGIKDVLIDDKKTQIHTIDFRNTLEKVFGLHCDKKEFNGSVDFHHPSNDKIFKQLINDKIRDKEDFKEIQKLYFEHIYEEPKSEKEEEEYKKPKEKYSVDDDGGVEI